MEPVDADDELLSPWAGVHGRVYHYRDAGLVRLARQAARELALPDAVSSPAIEDRPNIAGWRSVRELSECMYGVPTATIEALTRGETGYYPSRATVALDTSLRIRAAQKQWVLVTQAEALPAPPLGCYRHCAFAVRVTA
jgi:hypothetical protein